MVKKLLTIAFTFACAVLFGSCDSSDDVVVDQFTLDENLFSKTYTVDGDGCCVLNGLKPIAGTEVQSKVANYGWKSIAEYDLQDNGKLSKENYFDDVVGGGPTHYWFESSQQMVKYTYIDAMPANSFWRMTWSYDEAKGFILFGDSNSKLADRYEQILEIQESGGNTLMYTMSKSGIRADGTVIYAMIVYKRMTDEELKKTQQNYTYDLNNK